MNNILFLGGNPEHCNMVRDIVSKYEYPVDVSVFGLLVNKNIGLKLEDYDVVVCTPGLRESQEMKSYNGIVITCNIRFKDYLEAILEATKMGKHVAIFAMEYLNRDIHFLNKVMALFKDVEFSFFSSEDIYSLTEEELSGKILVGHGQSIEYLASVFHCPFVPVKLDDKNTLESLSIACSIQGLLEKKAQRIERFERMGELAQMGTLFFDSDGKCTEVSDYAGYLLGVAPQDTYSVRGTKIISSVWGDGSDIWQKQFWVNGNAFFLSRKRYALTPAKQEVIAFIRPFSAMVRTSGRENKSDDGMVASWRFSDLMFCSSSYSQCIRRARRFSQTEAPILIEGETGTGKEVLVQSVHNESMRQKGPFVAVNCAALNNELLESELFGYEEGAFTGARKGGKQGLFELANNGTLFLDEISELPLVLQGKLLRALQEKKIMHMGGTKLIPVDVRIIAACNRPLNLLVQQGQFRRDLFYRLNILRLRIPPLRDRLPDLPGLVSQFIVKTQKRYDVAIASFSREAFEILAGYDWPGNVRELENVIERVCLLASTSEDVPALLREYVEESRAERFPNEEVSEENILRVPVGSMAQMQSFIMQEMLRMHGGNCTAAADHMKISRGTLWKNRKTWNDRDS